MDANNRTLDIIDHRDFWVGSAQLDLQLFAPADPRAVVLLAYTGADPRRETCIYDVAAELRSVDIATVLVDCLPDAYRNSDQESPLDRYFARMLGVRLRAALARLREFDLPRSLPIGVVGSGHCAAPALATADGRPPTPDAVVTIGRTVGFSDDSEPSVHASTLEIRGVDDAPAGISDPQFESARSSVELPTVEPPFESRSNFERLASLTRHWFRDELTETNPPTPNLPTRGFPSDFDLPPPPPKPAARLVGR